MKNVWYLLGFASLSMSVGLYANISNEQLKDDYSLMLRIRDRNRKYHVVIIPGDSLSKEVSEISLPVKSFQYEGALWDEVASMWEDFSRPEDVGCYTVKSLRKMEAESDNYYFELHLPIIQDEGSSAKKVCKITIDSSVLMKDALLVLNDFIEECHFNRHRKIVISETPEEEKIEKKKQPEMNSLTSLIDELDEQEVKDSFTQRSKPSAVSNYASNV